MLVGVRPVSGPEMGGGGGGYDVLPAPGPGPGAGPLHGFKSNLGRRRRNEDAVAIAKRMMQVRLPRDFVEDMAGVGYMEGGLEVGEGAGAAGAENGREEQEEEFSGFYVGDGHNGAEAAQFCAKVLLGNVVKVYKELSEVGAAVIESRSSDNCNNDCEEAWRREEGEEMGLGHHVVKRGPTAKDVLGEAYKRTDAQFARYPQASRVGTTALVALIGEKHLCVASCGDSRAVLYRRGEPVPLSTEHKVEIPQEKARILNAGGKVQDSRVMGILNMSRAIGDRCLRSLGVIPDPDVLTLKRDYRDEYLVMATDGLWDVMCNEEVYIVLCHALERAKALSVRREKALQMGANSLCRTAMDRGSWDNITVVIVDLTSTVLHE